MDDGLASNWYVVMTKPNQEHFVESNLSKLEAEVFCPRIKQYQLIRRKYTQTTSPLFPGYVFTRVCLATQYRAVIYARGVRNLLSFGGTPAVVGAEVVDAIRAKLQGGYIEIPRHSFTPGAAARIGSGPLQGLHVVFEREMTGSQRAMVLWKTLAYQARVVIDLKDLVCA